MRQEIFRTWQRLLLVTVLMVAGRVLSPAASPVADSPTKKVVLGGPHGVVRNAQGYPIEGMMVQLISHKTAIRTTVYTNALGQYEFPKLESGSYTWRTPRALEYRTYEKEDVSVTGSPKLDDIVMERVSENEFLPPNPEILSQLTDGEWLYNIPGTGQEKRIFSNYCGTGCHTYQMQMRSRLDERSWRLILHRMLDYGGRILVGPPGRNPVPPDEQEEREILVKWLAKVRGPDAQNPPLKVFPRPHGAATRAIVTEYELPWVGVHVHDVYLDPQGNVWFTINRSPFIGKLDPKTGQVASYRTPGTPDKHPGGHWLQVEPDGKVWYSETWAQNLIEFDPKTEKFRLMHTGLQGNMALSPKDGTIWRTSENKVNRYDRETGKPVESYPMQNIRETYGNWISWDARYVSGGNRDRKFDGMFFFDRQTNELKEIPSPSGVAAASRGSFDPDGNSWAGGRGGVLLKYDRKTGAATEYAPPTPYQTFYETRADKNGEIWAGEMRGGRIARFNPRNEQWTEYVMPEPFSFDWQTYVDNTTDPVTVWYGDQYGYIVRIQLLDQEAPAPGKDAAKDAPKSAEKQVAGKEGAFDEYQRSGQVLYMQRMGKSGADRGQEIYYTKCWICHNDYTRKVDPKAAPTLKGLYQRARLMSGKPVNEETVMTQIREGSANMPSYQAGLNDNDLADLMSYLKEKCCWDENNPPANPRYR